uniref:Putative secreted peptide n=1 Tax=Anopheles braziliensis TaxID=58242 RepID=A0A2M3ZUW7_9DIPT
MATRFLRVVASTLTVVACRSVGSARGVGSSCCCCCCCRSSAATSRTAFAAIFILLLNPLLTANGRLGRFRGRMDENAIEEAHRQYPLIVEAVSHIHQCEIVRQYFVLIDDLDANVVRSNQ